MKGRGTVEKNSNIILAIMVIWSATETVHQFLLDPAS